MTETPLPTAQVELTQRRTLAWLLPLGALGLALFLLVQVLSEGGTRIVIRASEGHGIEAGDALRYRGIEVGRVEDARLTEDLAAVDLVVRLDPRAEAIAVAGSRFWVVRPRLTVDRVQGLDTVVGARHLAVDPGGEDAPRQTEFVALEASPVVEHLEPGGLELFLEASTRYGLTEGAPVTYRQLQVGHVLSVGLSSDATAVELRAWIRPEYVQLVRTNSVFWETGGVELGMSLTEGLRLDVGTLRSLLIGGVAFATPNDPGALATTGARFALYGEAEEDWLEWTPPLAVGSQLLPTDQAPPRLLRAVHRWEQGRILTGARQRTGWVLPVEGGVLGPSDLLVAEEGAHEGTATLEVGGARIALVSAPAWHDAGLARREVQLEAPAFDLERARPLPEQPEEVLVFSAPGAAPMALSASRLAVDGRDWTVDRAIAFDESWNGSAVLARADGALLGVLLVGEGRARVVAVPRP